MSFTALWKKSRVCFAGGFRSGCAGNERLRVVIAVVLAFGFGISGCARGKQRAAGEDPEGRGQHLTYMYNCGSCHIIPGVPEAKGTLGPPLAGVAARIYIAGLLVNTPENLAHWIRSPQQVHAGSAMPDLGVTQQQAEDIAAYLYSLR
jgi:cytochrome c